MENNNDNVSSADIGTQESLIQKPIVDIQTSGIQGEDNKVISEGFQNLNNNFYEKEKKVWPFVLIGVVLLLVGTGCFYYFVYTNPMSIMKKTINDSYENIKKSGKKVDLSEVNSMIVNSDLIITSESADLKDINGLNAKINVGIDSRNKNNNYVDVSLLKNKEKLFDGIMSVIDNKLYLSLKEAFPKVIYFETDDGELFDDGSFDIKINTEEATKMYSNLEYISSIVKDIVINNISSDKLSKEILFKEVDGKKILAVDVKYTISNSELKKILSAVYDGIVNDNKALEILASLSQTDVKVIKEGLASAKSEIDKISIPGTINITVTVNAFTKKLVQVDISYLVLNAKIIKNGDVVKLNVNMMGMITIDATIDNKDEKLSMNMNVINSLKMSLNAKNEETNNKPSKTTVSCIIYDPQDNSKEMLTVAGNFSYEYNKEIKSIDIKDAVDEKELTDEERAEIEKILEPLENMFPDSEEDIIELDEEEEL